MFDGIDLNNLDLNKMMGQFQEMTQNAQEENAKKYLLQKQVEEWLKFL